MISEHKYSVHVIFICLFLCIRSQVSPSYQAWGLNWCNGPYDDGDDDTTAEVDGVSGTDSMDPPPIQNPPTLMDWSELPCPKNLDVAVVEGTIDLFSEINRAKSHKCFPFFMQWLINKHDLPEDHVWGHPEDEPVEDLRDFITFLVEAGYGNFASGDNMETQLHDIDATPVEETRMH